MKLHNNFFQKTLFLIQVMRLIVAGDRLDPPIGVPAEVYDIMLCCWNTDAEKRPRFAELVTVFEGLLKVPFYFGPLDHQRLQLSLFFDQSDQFYLVFGLFQRDDLVAEPLPPIRHRLANERSVSATPSMSRTGDPHPASTTSQAKIHNLTL